MAGSTVVSCAAGAYTKVATNVTKCKVNLLTGLTGQSWLYTTRATGGGAPTLQSEGVPCGLVQSFDVVAAIDIYVWPVVTLGTVRTDT